jgi:hypothetical protein
MSKQIVTFSLCISLLLVSAPFTPGLFAASVETVGDLKVQGVVESTSGGFKFPGGATLSDVGNISANSASTAFQVTQSGSGHAIDASSMSGDAVHATAVNTAIYGESSLDNGILGFTNANGSSNAGVFGSSNGIACGVYGHSTAGGYGVRGSSSTGDAIHGESSGTGVYGQSSGNVGVLGYTTASGAPGAGVKGLSHSNAYGVYGQGTGSGAGVYGENSGSGYGVVGYSSGSALAAGRFISSSTGGNAIIAESPSGTQVMKADATGIHAGPGMTGTPLAYGFFRGTDGLKFSGSSNITCTLNVSQYECTINGENFFYMYYVVSVTPVATIAIPTTGSVSGKLTVVFYDLDGSTILPNSFSVIIYKP